MKIKFVNWDLGFDSGHHTLAGQSGKWYGGPSVFDREYSCQSLTVEFAKHADFVSAMKDIALKYGLYGERWVPIHEWPAPQLICASAPNAGRATSDSTKRAEVLPSTPYFAMKKIAADEGVHIFDCASNVERAARINAAREAKSAAELTPA